MTNSTTIEPLRPQSNPAFRQDSTSSLLSDAATSLSTQRECCRICEDLADEGITINWYNFESEADGTLEKPSGRPSRGLTLCLNLAGHGSLCAPNRKLSFSPLTAFVYATDNYGLPTWRKPGERHRFLTIDFSISFLHDQLMVCEEVLHPVVRSFMTAECRTTNLGKCVPLTAEHEQLVSLLLRPQCSEGPCRLRCKGIVLQLIADLLVRPCCANESECDRQKCLGLERARKVVAILERDLADPPALEQIGREVGCSPFYLSRTFSREMGMTIPQCVRTLRMRYAAKLLKGGRCNVTEAAMAVGYSSLSHFSQAFCQEIGCCPAVYSPSALGQSSAPCPDRCPDGKHPAPHANRPSSNGPRSEIDVLLESVG